MTFYLDIIYFVGAVCFFAFAITSAYRRKHLDELEGRGNVESEVARSHPQHATSVVARLARFSRRIGIPLEGIHSDLMQANASNQSLQPTPLPVALLFFMSYLSALKPRPQRRG